MHWISYLFEKGIFWFVKDFLFFTFCLFWNCFLQVLFRRVAWLFLCHPYWRFFPQSLLSLLVWHGCESIRSSGYTRQTCQVWPTLWHNLGGVFVGATSKSLCISFFLLGCSDRPEKGLWAYAETGKAQKSALEVGVYQAFRVQRIAQFPFWYTLRCAFHPPCPRAWKTKSNFLDSRGLKNLNICVCGVPD